MYDVKFHHCKQSLAACFRSMEKASMFHLIKESIRSKVADTNPNQYYFFDQHWWMQDSYKAWLSAFPWLSKRTIGQYLRDLSTTCYHDGPPCETERCLNPALISKKASSETSGQIPNFYRPNPQWKPGKKAHTPPRKNCVSPDAKIACPHAKIAFPSISNNQTSNHHETTTADNPQASKIDEAAEVLGYYESKFGRAGKRAREQFKMTYCTESSSDRQKFNDLTDRLYSCEFFLRPTTHSPMRLFSAEAVISQRTALRYRIREELSSAFDRPLAINRIVAWDAVKSWFSGDPNKAQAGVFSMLDFC